MSYVDLSTDSYLGLTDPALIGLPTLARWRYFRERLWERDGRCCTICGAPLTLTDMHIDHIVQRQDGGVAHWDNLRATHRRCNLSRAKGPARPRSTGIQPDGGQLIIDAVYFNTAETAAYLGVTPARVRQLILAGQLTAHRVGRDWAIDERALPRAAQRPGRGYPKGRPRQ